MTTSRSLDDNAEESIWQHAGVLITKSRSLDDNEEDSLEVREMALKEYLEEGQEEDSSIKEKGED